MITLSYDTERCLDGLTLVGGFFRPLSARREPVHVVTVDLEDPVVLQFLNARDDLLPFMSRYSAGDVHGPRELVHINAITHWQNLFREKIVGADLVDALVTISRPDSGVGVGVGASFHLQGGKPQMQIRCNTLLDF